jgi:hypothetical protein
MSDTISTLETDLRSSAGDTTWNGLVLHTEDTAESFAEFRVPATALNVVSPHYSCGSGLSSIFRDGGTNGWDDGLA